MKQRERFLIELNHTAIRLTQLSLIIVLVVWAAILFTSVGGADGLGVGASLVIALIPFGLAPTIRILLQETAKPNKLALHDMKKAVRCTLASSAGQLETVVLGLVGMAYAGVVPPLTIAGLIIADLALIVPITALRWDAATKKPPKAADDHMIDRRNLGRYAGFGIVCGAAVYANFLFFFARHNLSPDHLEHTLPLYQQATTLSLVSIIFCGFAYLLFERADQHEAFFTDHLTSNPKLLQAFGISLLGLIFVIHVPGIAHSLRLRSLDFVDWTSALLCAGLYMCFRLLQRHTRKHARRNVLKLHHEVHGR